MRGLTPPHVFALPRRDAGRSGADQGGFDMAKVKAKTHKGAAKRFRITGTGKLIAYKAGKNHLLAKKSAARKRRISKKQVLAKGDAARMRRAIQV